VRQAAAPRIIYTPARNARFVGQVDAVTLAKRMDRHHRLQLNQDQVLWEEARRIADYGDIVRLCVDTLHGAELYRVHVYGTTHGGYPSLVVTVAVRIDGVWSLIDNQIVARGIGMDLLYEVCRDEVGSELVGMDLDGLERSRLRDELTEKALQDVIDCHITPELAAERAVDDLLYEEVC